MTDLVFTLFAVSILLLAVVGSNGAVRERSLAESLSAQEAIVSELRAQAAEDVGAGRRDASGEALRRRVAELEADLSEARRAAVPPPAPPVPPAEPLSDAATKEALRQAEVLRTQVAALEVELDRQRRAAVPPPAPPVEPLSDAAMKEALRQAEVLRTQVAALEVELDRQRRAAEAARERSARRFQLTTLYADGPQGFLAGGVLSNDMLDDLRIALGQNFERMRRAGTNRIALEIDVAPRIGDGEGGDVDRELEESLDVTRALARRLRATAMPMPCLAFQPSGKARAAPFVGVGQGPGGGASIEAFEDLGGGPFELSRSREALERAAAADNRIVALAESVPDAPCESQVLLEGIRQWINAPVP